MNQKNSLNRAISLTLLKYKNGIYKMFYKPVYFGIYLLVMVLWVYSGIALSYFNNEGSINAITFFIVAIFVALMMTLSLIIMPAIFGTPWRYKKYNYALRQCGMYNALHEYPVLVSVEKDSEYNSIILKFDNPGIPLESFREKREELQTAMDGIILQFSIGENSKELILNIFPGTPKLPEKLFWCPSLLSNEDFEILLGATLTGNLFMNLNSKTHWLIGGTTGSGKSVLLKNIIYQAYCKGAKIYIADFKGGVDYAGKWHEIAEVIVTEENLISILNDILIKMAERKKLLLASGCVNISEYNSKHNNGMQRIVIAFDEVAEVLDKTGADKDRKATIAEIEQALSTIARQSRAFGIHLVLATQRPDANILTGQIRSNIDGRVCGRADDVLSKIVLDNTNASEVIDKNEHGVFLDNDGNMFLAYYFSEKMIKVKGNDNGNS